MKKITKIDLDKLLNKPVQNYEKFHFKTMTQQYFPNSDQNDWPDVLKKIYYKGYERLKFFRLQKPKQLASSLSSCLIKRASRRDYTGKELNNRIISSLIFYSAGINDQKLQSRFYPSAGARYPLELYILSKKTFLPSGLYHYYVPDHGLEQLLCMKNIDFRDYFAQEWIKDASLVIIITAVFKRSTYKYQDRGYRYIYLEAGHLGQNIYLCSEALGLSCCAVGGFLDKKLNKLLNIDGIEEASIYALAIG